MALRVFFIAILLSGCQPDGSELKIDQQIFGHRLVANADSEIAHYFASSYLAGDYSNPGLDKKIEEILSSFNPLDTNQLERITAKTSHDFASLLLAQRLLEQNSSSDTVALFHQFYGQLKRGVDLKFQTLQSNTAVLFIPGWLYKKDASTGADFAQQRALLNKHGIENFLLDIDENGTVSRNAKRVSERIADYALRFENLILVSVSKGGPETALAINSIKDQPAFQKIRGWVNVGGLLQGTALADKAERFPWSWFARLVVLQSKSKAGIQSLATSASITRAEKIGAIDDLLIINYVAIPMASQISDRASIGFNLMKDSGPNDGLTFALDAIQRGNRSVTIPELGLDHYFNHADIDLITLALAQTAIEESR